MNRLLTNLVWFLGVSLLFSSCIPHQELLNFSEGEEFPTTPEAIKEDMKLRIQPDDLLGITVHTLDETTSRLFNIGAESGSNAENSAPKYLVDSKGNIEFPVIGTIPLSGLTTELARDTISNRLKTYLKDPIVNIRFLNFKVTVLGAVNQPTTLSFSEERVSILEAIGTAGDLNSGSRRDNILVIREYDNQREYGRINLRSKKLFTSPYYYLQPNDIVYVEPLKAATAPSRNRAQQILPWVTTVSVLASLLIAIF